ncbi:MAG: hypothetical protein WA364_11855 [Candidatus Nitrosopolaris sp.]
MEYKSEPSRPNALILSDNTVETIWKRAEGNPRQMLQLASEALRKTVKINSTIIEPIISE